MPKFLPTLNLKARSVRLFTVVGLFGALANVSNATLDEKDVFDKLVLNPNLKTFVNLIAQADLIEQIKKEDHLTIFAPTDAAFKKMPTELLVKIKKDKAILKKFLTYHMFAGTITSKEFKDGPIKMMEGEVAAMIAKPPAKFNKAKVLSVDDVSANGVVHLIDAYSIPPSLFKEPESKPKQK